MEQLGPADPQRIGGYHLLGRLGAGGMGEVFLARSGRGRTVAVKLVRPELAEQDEFRSRFRKEVQAARRVGGHWTAPVLDADTEADVPWVATGYIAGPSLQQVVTRSHGPLPEDSVRVLAAGLGYALRDIHAAGLVHRDLKPSNVLLTIDGPRVIDFGIARALETVTDGGLTRTDAVIGSPGFMSPEQVRGHRLTPAADIFCLGSVLAFAACGQLPFGSPEGGHHALMFRIVEEEPELSEVPESLRELIADCLRKEAADRPSLTQILERTGAEGAVRDGRVADTWLPGGLTAELARHAVELLNHEYAADNDPGDAAGPSSDSPGLAPSEAAPSAAGAPGPFPPATPGAPAHSPAGAPGFGGPTFGYPPPYPGPAHRSPHPAPYPAPTAGYPRAYGPAARPLRPYPRPSRPTAGQKVAIALAAVAMVLGAALLSSLLELGSSGGSSADGKGGKASADDARSSAPEGEPAGDGDDEGDAPAAEGRTPQAFVGTWQASFDAPGGGRNTRVLVITEGGVGDTVMSLRGYGPGHDCTWSATLRAPGPPLRLSESEVGSGATGSCSPGEWSRLTVRGSGQNRTLVRELVGSGGTPLTYRYQGPP